MTSSDLDAIWKANIDEGRFTAMRALWMHGYCAGAAVTPSASTPDLSASTSKPTAIIKLKNRE